MNIQHIIEKAEQYNNKPLTEKTMIEYNNIKQLLEQGKTYIDNIEKIITVESIDDITYDNNDINIEEIINECNNIIEQDTSNMDIQGYIDIYNKLKRNINRINKYIKSPKFSIEYIN